MGTLLSSPCQLRLGVDLSCLPRSYNSSSPNSHYGQKGGDSGG